MINPEDIKVNVTFTEGYAQRFTAACLRQLEIRRNKSNLQVNTPEPVCGSAVSGIWGEMD